MFEASWRYSASSVGAVATRSGARARRSSATIAGPGAVAGRRASRASAASLRPAPGRRMQDRAQADSHWFAVDEHLVARPEVVAEAHAAGHRARRRSSLATWAAWRPLRRTAIGAQRPAPARARGARATLAGAIALRAVGPTLRLA